jgi:alkylhydroperoxidase/carboxymuconolactone decarboxylase family protein YurZ
MMGGAGLAAEPDPRLERGLEQFRRMAGPGRAEEVRAERRRISPEFEQFALTVLAGEVWTRPGLDLRARSLVTIAALAALGRPRGLALNIEMALSGTGPPARRSAKPSSRSRSMPASRRHGRPSRSPTGSSSAPASQSIRK